VLGSGPISLQAHAKSVFWQAKGRLKRRSTPRSHHRYLTVTLPLVKGTGNKKKEKREKKEEGKMRTICLLLVLAFLAVALSGPVASSIWPEPAHFEQGNKLRTIDGTSFVFTSSSGDIPTLTQAFDRYNKLLFTHPVKGASTPAVKVLVSVKDASEDYPQLDTDESYKLQISDDDKSAISIDAQTVYGALRGIESLSQLVRFDFDIQRYVIDNTPISVDDEPRYNHRGLLLDTSRHFQSIADIKRTIDALSYAKFNVFHWHVVDTQSFPFESVTYPKLWQGSYTKQERYTQLDMADVVEYGRARGVKVMIEFDMPGHAASWCAGYPEICPSANCLQPLDPSKDATWTLIQSLLGECTGNGTPGKGLFPYNLIHLGADEVSYECWEASPTIQAWEKQNNINGSEGTYEYFVDRTASIARKLNRLPVQWVEVFEHFGSNLDNNTVIHIWKEKTTLDEVVVAGYRALLSNQDVWYLDHLEVSWDSFYLNEPTDGLSPTADASLILGGETCMWGETVDGSDLDATIWPRAAAAGERMWTAKDSISKDLASVEGRLETFKCLLMERGIGAAPVTNRIARFQPKQPGSCYAQRRLVDQQ